MTYEDDYKKWLEEMLIKSNPDWVCDGMYDLEFTHEWCGEHCGEDSNYVTPKCLHLYYHHIARADRKTEPSSSEIPNNCETCKWGEWYRQGYDITMMSDECGGCCSWNNKWKPKDEPTISKMEQVDKDINVRSKDETQTESLHTCSVNGRPYSECSSCEHFKCTADELQTEREGE